MLVAQHVVGRLHLDKARFGLLLPVRVLVCCDAQGYKMDSHCRTCVKHTYPGRYIHRYMNNVPGCQSSAARLYAFLMAASSAERSSSNTS